MDLWQRPEVRRGDITLQNDARTQKHSAYDVDRVRHRVITEIPKKFDEVESLMLLYWMNHVAYRWITLDEIYLKSYLHLKKKLF